MKSERGLLFPGIAKLHIRQMVSHENRGYDKYRLLAIKWIFSFR